jgi:HK97 family phage major capsid protein
LSDKDIWLPNKKQSGPKRGLSPQGGRGLPSKFIQERKYPIMGISHSALKGLYAERARVNSICSGMLAGNGLTSETRSQFDLAMVEVERITKQIREAEAGGFAAGFRPNDQKHESRHTEAFGRFIRKGDAVLTPEQRSVLETRAVSEGNQAAHIGSYSSLGYFVPTGFVDRVEVATKWFAPLLEDGIFGVIRTSTGQALPFPTSDDTGNQAFIVGEAASVTDLDVTAGQVILSSYKLTSGVVKASIELLQDSSIDVEQYLADRFGERFGRAYENLLTNGNGSGQPTGLLTALAANGVTPVVATGSSESTGGAQTGVNSIGYSDLVNLEHSVDPSYRRNAKYMFHDLTLASIKKILDKFGRPLWTPGIAVGEPDTINGYQYVINQSLPVISPSAATVVFGDLTKFTVRRVAEMSLLRLVELYANLGQVGFQAFSRIDSNLTVSNSTHPINYLQMHS